MEFANLRPACALHGNQGQPDIAELARDVGGDELECLVVLIGNRVTACHLIDDCPVGVVVGAFETPFLRSAVVPITIIVCGERVFLDSM